MDLRIEKTYRALLDAFMRLLSEQRYEKISVAMLCDAACIRRTTFYKHFADKDAFFAFFVDALYRELAKEGEREERDGRGRGAAVLRELAEFLLAHERLVDNIFGSAVSMMMVSVMYRKVAQAVRDRCRDGQEGRPEQKQAFEAAVEFSAGGIVRLLERWWLDGHDPAGIDRLCALCDSLVDRVVAGA